MALAWIPRTSSRYRSSEPPSRSHGDAKGVIEKSPAIWAAGFEFPAGKDLWISAGMGKAYEKVKAPDRVFVFANVKWGVSGKGRLDPN